MTSNTSAPSRGFTIRVPQELYLKLCECASSDDLTLNVKVNQLLRLGLGEHVNLNAVLAKMLVKLSVTRDPAND